MIRTRYDLKQYIKADSKNYYNYKQSIFSLKYWKIRLTASPINDQSLIWFYIKTLRYTEYYYNQHSWIKRSFALFYLHRLRRLSRLTGFQIPVNVLGKGITIWHWGPLIINPKSKLGDNCVLRPDVVIGYKTRSGIPPTIGNNVVINSGSRIIGDDIIIGDNCIIAPGAIVTKSFPSNCVIGGCPARIIKMI